MSREGKLQSEIAGWLRKKGCYVMVVQPQAGIPQGCPDIVALFDGGGWVALEVKKEYPYRKDGAAKKGAFQPLQQETIKKLDGYFYSKVVWPENWQHIKEELERMI